MALKTVKITYLYNSGFAVEMDDRMLIFDYCSDIPEGNKRGLSSGVVSLEDLKRKKLITVFVSHSHWDHFNATVLRWQQKQNNIQYILSNDIALGKNAIHIGEGEMIDVSQMNVKAFKSNDKGVCFLINTDGISIFHAGDLNLWCDELDLDDEKIQEKRMRYRHAKISFQKALESIKGNQIDIAFFPVDPRIGKGYDAGATYFAQLIKPKLFVPMHFGSQFDACDSFSKKNDLSDMQYFNICKRGQQYLYEKSE